LQVARQAGLSPQAVGPDGRPVDEQLAHSLRGGPVDDDLVTIDGPELRVPAAEAVARLRAADAGQAELSLTDRLLDAIAQEPEIPLGIVDGRGGVVGQQARPRPPRGR